MANIATFGLSKIELGEIPADGGMATTLQTLGLTYQDTCKLMQEDPEVTEHFAEEYDDAIVAIAKMGKTTLTFSIMDADVTTLKELLGGTLSGEGDAQKWNAPNDVRIIEKSIRITPKSGLMVEIPRAMIRAKLNADFSKKGLFLVDITATVLTPMGEGSTAKISVSKKAE